MPPKKAETKEVALATMGPKMQELYAMCVELSKSRIIPVAYAGNPAGIFAAVQYGKELGIGAMTALMNIAVINGRPTLGADLALGIAMRHKEFAGYEVLESTEKYAKVVVYRHWPLLGKTIAYIGEFSEDDAKKAGLINVAKPDAAWNKWKKRMLKHRATAFAVRDAFPAGSMYTDEEMDPETTAEALDQELRFDDNIHASILDERGVPVETVAATSAPTPAQKKRAKSGLKKIS